MHHKPNSKIIPPTAVAVPQTSIVSANNGTPFAAREVEKLKKLSDELKEVDAIFTLEDEVILFDLGLHHKGSVVRYNPMRPDMPPRISTDIFGKSNREVYIDLLDDKSVLCTAYQTERVLLDKDNKVIHRKDITKDAVYVTKFQRINATTYLFLIFDSINLRSILATIPYENIKKLFEQDLSQVELFETWGLNIKVLDLLAGLKANGLEGSVMSFYGQDFRILKDNFFMVLDHDKTRFFVYQLGATASEKPLTFLTYGHFDKDRRVSSCDVLEPGQFVVSYQMQHPLNPAIKIATYHLDDILKPNWDVVKGAPAESQVIKNSTISRFTKICLGGAGKTLYCFGVPYSIDKYRTYCRDHKLEPMFNTGADSYWVCGESYGSNVLRVDIGSLSLVTALEQVPALYSSHTMCLSKDGWLYAAGKSSIQRYNFSWDSERESEWINQVSTQLETALNQSRKRDLIPLILSYVRMFRTERSVPEITPKDDKAANTNLVRASAKRKRNESDSNIDYSRGVKKGPRR